MTSLEKLRRASQLIRSSNHQRKKQAAEQSNSRHKQNQTISVVVDNNQNDERKRVKRQQARQTQKRCSELIRKKLELEQRQRDRLKAAIKIQAAWRGYLARKNLEKQYEQLLEKEHEFVSNRQSIIDAIKEPNNSEKKSTTSRLEKELEDVMQLKEELHRQMEEIGQLKDRLERKDKEREQYYINYIRQLEEKYKQKDVSKDIGEQVKIEDEGEEDDSRRDRIKGRVARMLQAILEQRIQYQLSLQPQQPPEGFCVNLGQISLYLQRAVNYIERNHHEQCASNVNRRFGFSCARRLTLLHEDTEEDNVENSYSQEILHFVVPQTIFEELEELINEHGEERHFRKAIFDSLNEVLTTFRPFYRQSSEPYPWSVMNFQHHSLQLSQALATAQQAILNSSKILCGLIITLDADIQNQLALRNRNWKIDVFERREEQATMTLLHQWIRETPDWQYREDQRAEISIEVSDWLLEELVAELIQWVSRFGRLRSIML